VADDTTREREPELGQLSFGPAMPGDFVGIAELDRHAWRESAHPERVPDGEHVWRVWVDDAFVFVARERGHAVGAIVALPSRHGTLFVHKVMVDESRRRRGIGTHLFELLLAHVDATVGAACYLTVDPSKAAEVTRYEHLGFTEKRFVPGFYREDEDRFVMTRPARRGAPA
jgi:[ribosomal protein S18]-alanine N-acetyltransferase